MAESLGPFRIGPEARAEFTNAIRNGEGFRVTVDIRHNSLPRFDSEDFDESQFLSVFTPADQPT